MLRLLGLCPALPSFPLHSCLSLIPAPPAAGSSLRSRVPMIWAVLPRRLAMKPALRHHPQGLLLLSRRAFVLLSPCLPLPRLSTLLSATGSSVNCPLFRGACRQLAAWGAFPQAQASSGGALTILHCFVCIWVLRRQPSPLGQQLQGWDRASVPASGLVTPAACCPVILSSLTNPPATDKPLAQY